jgi:hypothetical protein
VLVIDETAKKIIDNVVKEDDILNENIASMWQAGTGVQLGNIPQISRGSRKRENPTPTWTLYTFYLHNPILSIV